MGLFTSEKKIKAAPRTAGSIAGEQFLKEQLYGVPRIPARGTAGLTGTQSLILQALGPLLTSVSDSNALARGEYEATLRDQYDPETSRYYQSTRDALERGRTKAVTADRQRAQLGGMLHSTPAAGVESATRMGYDTMIGQVLGQLQETERGRKLEAAEGLQRGEAQGIQNLGALSNVADIERAIEQQKADALYNQALAQILFPYETQTGIASALMNYQKPTYTTGGGLTDFGFAATLGGNLASSALSRPQTTNIY